MSLVEYDLLDGKKDKVKIAIERIKTFEPKEGYYVAFSGGKDSVVILDLVRKSGCKYDAHYNLTTVDPPELVQFIKTFKDVKIELPRKSMWQLIVEKRMPPTRIVRYCCEELKERGGDERIVVTGVRWEESARRAKRRMFETCKIHKLKKYLHPVIDWSEEDVWEYIKQEQVQYCKLYDEGWNRIGCIMCPYAGTHKMKKDAERWPKIYQAYLRAFDRCLKKRVTDGLETKWKTAQEMMDWWLYGVGSTKETDQSCFIYE